MNHEKKVGIVVAGALLLLLGAVVLIGRVRVGVSGYELTVKFKFVNDLKPDAQVKFAGGPVIGRVKTITVDEDLVKVGLWIDREVKLREDCEFWIFTSGMLGEVYVEVNASHGGVAPYIPDGATIRGVDPISIDATMIRMGKMMDALAPIFAKEEVIASVHRMVVNLDRVGSSIAKVVDRRVAGVDRSLGDLEAFTKSLGKMSKDLETIVANAKVLTSIDSPDGLKAGFSKLNEAMVSLNSAAKQVDVLATKVTKSEGLLGAVINDPALKKDFHDLIKQLKDKPIQAKVRLF